MQIAIVTTAMNLIVHILHAKPTHPLFPSAEFRIAFLAVVEVFVSAH